MSHWTLIYVFCAILKVISALYNALELFLKLLDHDVELLFVQELIFFFLNIRIRVVSLVLATVLGLFGCLCAFVSCLLILEYVKLLDHIFDLTKG